MTTKLNAKALRSSSPSQADLAKIKRREIYIICDNILDTYNIGSIFRLADAVAASKIYLCGATATPPYHRISKAAVGCEKWVPWQYQQTAAAAIKNVRNLYEVAPRQRLREERPRLKVVAIEQSKESVDFRKVEYREPIAFIVGHETSGVSKEALKLADEIVELPMFGVNKSLNVMVSLAIVLYRSI